MGVLFCGSVPQSFEVGANGLAASTSSNYGASSFAPEVIRFIEEQLGIGRFAPQGELYASLRWRSRGTAVSSGREPMMLRAGEQAWVGVRSMGGTNGQLQVARWDGSAWEELGSFAFASDESYAWHLEVATGAAGAIRFWLNDIQIFDWSGDLSGMPELDNIRIAPIQNTSSQSNQSGMSEIIVADHETRRMRLQSLPLTSDGAAFEWSGSAGDISGASISDTSFAASDTAGQRLLAQHGGLGTGDTLDVRAVVISSRIRRQGGPEEVAGLARVDGVDHQTDAVALTAEFEVQQFILEANPATGVLWERGAVDATEIGLVSVAP